MPGETERKVINISLPCHEGEAKRSAHDWEKAKGEFAIEALKQYVKMDKRWTDQEEGGWEGLTDRKDCFFTRGSSP